MTIKQALAQAREQLAQAGVPDPDIDAELMLSHVLDQSRLMLRLNGQTELTTEQEQRFSMLLLSRASRKPLQYLLGEQYFYGLRFQVDERVLIPRQETEELCECGIAHLRSLNRNNLSVLDLCTGSGAIAVTIKHECPSASVTASDLSTDALSLASLNARANGAEITFVQGDLWVPLEGRQFDLILSNPPYIPTQDCAELQQEVLQEPVMALDGGTDGLNFYRRIAQEAPAHLTQDGFIAVEVGIHQAKDVAALFAQAGLSDVSIQTDLCGVERIVSARRSSKHV